MIAKVFGTATVFAALVLGAGRAGAEPLPPEPNPFGGLTCECQEPVPGEGPGPTSELQRGLNGSHQLADYHRHGRYRIELVSR